ncbi:MAG TPA: hemolysin III family protein [Bacteroidales bacterium]
MVAKTHYYSKNEELLNVITHGIGFLLSVVALVFLVVHASSDGTVWHVVSFAIYGASLVVLYLASMLFHSAKNQKTRARLNVFDHASIYLLIAGTYTPFALVTLHGAWGWSIFGTIWGLAIAGIVLKLFFTGQYNFLSTLLYIFMGWIVLIAIVPLVHALSFSGLMWLFGGGLFYTIGAVIFLIDKLPYNHAIFHFFVLAGSACHFVAVFCYVL